jgi:RNA polymerase sigma factor (sigma-70 family)
MMKAHLWRQFLSQSNDETFAPLFDAEKNIVWTICARFLDTPEDTDEAFQTTWTRMILEVRAERILENDAHEHLCRIAGREADALRKRINRRRQRDTPMEPSHESIPSPTPPGAPIIESERRAVIEALVAQLPDKLRLPVQLHYLNGMTQREVAATLGVPPSTIDSRLKTALGKLRPLAERAGLRDVLGMLAAGGMSAGLVSAPAGITAPGVFGASASASTVAVGLLGSTAAKICAVAVFVALVIGVATFWSRFGGITESHSRIAVMDGADGPQAAQAGGEVSDRGEAYSIESAQADVLGDDAENSNTSTGVSVAEEGVKSAARVDKAQSPKAESGAAPLSTRFMSILVTDKQTGEALEGAWTRVRASWYDEERMTDHDGVARYQDVPLGQVRVMADAEGLARDGLYVEVGTSDPVIEFELSPAAVVYGRVLLESGEPASDVTVGIANNSIAAMSTRTDEKGYYEIANVARGVHLNHVTAGSYPNRTSFDNSVLIPLETEQYEQNFTLVVQPTQRLAGWVMDARTGQPIAGARLRAGTMGWAEELARTNNVGEFTIGHYVPTVDQIFVQAKGYAPRTITHGDATGGSVRVELERGLIATGHVVDEEGKPVVGARLTAESETGHTIGESVYTNEDGRFRIENLSAGAALRVFITGHGNVAYVRDIAGESNLRIDIEWRVPLSGRVIDEESGDPIRQYRLRIGAPGPASSTVQAPDVLPMASWDPGYLIDSEDGTFKLAEFKRGDAVAIIISADGYATREIDPFLVAEEMEPIALSRVTGPARTWRGLVRAEDGSPVPNARLVLVAHRRGETEIPHRVGDEYFSFIRRMRMRNVVHEATSDADGTFDLGSMILPHGGTLVAESDHHIAERLQLDDDSPLPIEITMRTGTHLRVEFDRGTYPNAWSVEFWHADGRDPIHVALPPSANHLEIGTLDPGVYLANLMVMGTRSGNRSRMLRPTSRTVELVFGQQALLDFNNTDGFIVEGRVMDGDGPWTEGAILHLERRQPRFDKNPHLLDMYLAAYETLVSADGSFFLRNVDAGTYQLRLHGLDSGYSNEGIGGGEPFEITGSMSGLIVERR